MSIGYLDLEIQEAIEKSLRGRPHIRVEHPDEPISVADKLKSLKKQRHGIFAQITRLPYPNYFLNQSTLPRYDPEMIEFLVLRGNTFLVQGERVRHVIHADITQTGNPVGKDQLRHLGKDVLRMGSRCQVIPSHTSLDIWGIHGRGALGPFVVMQDPIGYPLTVVVKPAVLEDGKRSDKDSIIAVDIVDRDTHSSVLLALGGVLPLIQSVARILNYENHLIIDQEPSLIKIE